MCRKNLLEEGADSITGKLLIHDNWQRTSRHFHYCILSRSKPGIPHIFISTRVFDLLHFLFKNLTQPETWLICKRQLLNFYYIILMAQSTKSNFIKHTQIYRSFNWLAWLINFPVWSSCHWRLPIHPCHVQDQNWSYQLMTHFWPLAPGSHSSQIVGFGRESRFSHFGLSRQLLS